MASDETLALEAAVMEFFDDPLGYVLFAYEWGKGELAQHKGPDAWQADLLRSIRDKLKSGKSREEAILEATTSGHGVGKSAAVAWLIDWAMSTQEDCKGVVTANTETQLRTKTWPELAKWRRLSITASWFTLTATALFSTDPAHEKTWRFDMVPWSERNTEAFAGLHNAGKRILLIFDEASAIPDVIWEVSEGALTDTDTEIIWAVFGNPTRPIGRFRDAFGRLRHRWSTREVDSRTAKMSNKKQLANWIEDYGLDSDFVRVRVMGKFPLKGAEYLLGADAVEKAMARHLRPEQYNFAAKILGVDVARQGLDNSAIFPRQGLATWRPRVMHVADSMLVADAVARAWDKWEADAAMVDATGGWGAGVVDRLIQMGYSPLAVEFGGKANDPRYRNKRTEIWWEMKNWIEGGGSLKHDNRLALQLCSQTYRFPNDRFVLDDKEAIRAEIGMSPDEADALACTFAYPVAPRNQGAKGGRRAKAHEDYDLFAALKGGNS